MFKLHKKKQQCVGESGRFLLGWLAKLAANIVISCWCCPLL